MSSVSDMNKDIDTTTYVVSAVLATTILMSPAFYVAYGPLSDISKYDPLDMVLLSAAYAALQLLALVLIGLLTLSSSPPYNRSVARNTITVGFLIMVLSTALSLLDIDSRIPIAMAFIGSWIVVIGAIVNDDLKLASLSIMIMVMLTILAVIAPVLWYYWIRADAGVLIPISFAGPWAVSILSLHADADVLKTRSRS